MINPATIKPICEAAAAAIMDVYDKDYTVFIKEDQSPFTIADEQSNDIITATLQQKYPDIPIISEEMVKQVDYDVRKNWPLFWLSLIHI